MNKKFVTDSTPYNRRTEKEDEISNNFCNFMDVNWLHTTSLYWCITYFLIIIIFLFHDSIYFSNLRHYESHIFYNADIYYCAITKPLL